ncbi:MAG: acyl-CoA dehydrogenase family protein [Mycobacterium sp.]|uniref:acyl-CoA dehydrogenase family protein n=1 Tax=Mycobacterium sp. TaxID=1785 RepID=UPI003C4DDF9C
MDINITQADEEFRDECRSWLRANVPSDIAPLETERGFAEHREWDRLLFDAGWSVVTWPVEYGGRDASLMQWLIFEEEYHLAGAGLRAAHNGISLLAPAIFVFGTDDQRSRYLRRMAAAEDIWCQGWSEPDAGSDIASLRSRAVRDDAAGGWRLCGQKTWTTRGAFSTHIFTLFRSSADEPRHKGLTYFLVPLDAPGVTVRGFGRVGGEVGFAEVFFDDVLVPDSDVLGKVNGGWDVAMATTSNERGLTLRSPAWFTAAAERLVAAWRGNCDPRDTRIADEVARCWIDAEAYRWATYEVAQEVASGTELGARASMAKLFWSELDFRLHEVGMEVTADQAHDADAYWTRGYLTALSGPIWGGTNEIQRDVVARRILGLPRS